MSSFLFAAIIGFFATGFNLITSIIISIQNSKNRQHPQTELMLVVFAWTFATFVESISYLYPMIILSQIIVFSYVGLMYAVLFFIDSITRESVDPLKIFFATILAIVVSVLGWNPLNYDLSLLIPLKTNVLIPFLLMNTYTGLLLFIYVIRIFLKSNQKLKKASAILSVGTTFATVFSTIATLFIDPILPASHLIFQSIGLFIIVIIWSRFPKLANVLPFEALRLDVIDTYGGLSLFTYIWSTYENNFDNTLYSSMLQGISVIITESLQRGLVTELKVEKGIIMLARDNINNIAAVLLATKNVKYLRTSLNQFLIEFGHQFEEELKTREKVSQFSPATKIVEQIFADIP
jgi:hypothetical protein